MYLVGTTERCEGIIKNGRSLKKTVFCKVNLLQKFEVKTEVVEKQSGKYEYL